MRMKIDWLFAFTEVYVCTLIIMIAVICEARKCLFGFGNKRVGVISECWKVNVEEIVSVCVMLLLSTHDVFVWMCCTGEERKQQVEVWCRCGGEEGDLSYVSPKHPRTLCYCASF